MASRIVVGVFESEGIAEDARNRLKTEGVPTSDIFLKILKEIGEIPSTMEPELEAGFLGPVIPGNFRESFAHYIHNGETLISIQALTDARVELAVDTLKQYAPLEVRVLPNPEGPLSSDCVDHPDEKAGDSGAASQGAGNAAQGDKPTPSARPQERKAAPPPDGAKPIVYDSADLVPSKTDPVRLDLKHHHPFVKLPTEMGELVRDVFAVERVICSLFSAKKYKSEREQFFNDLRITARSGLCGSDYDTETGQLNLTLTKDKIADTFPKIRDSLWNSYLKIVALSSVFFGLGCILYYYWFISAVFAAHNKNLLQSVPAFREICLALLWIPLGVAIGIFLEFVFRMGENITYEGLLLINPGRWKPWKRTTSTLITAYVFAFIIGVNAFQIGIAGILLNDFIPDAGRNLSVGRPWLSLAVGFVTGFTFPYVRDLVTQFKPERRDGSPPGSSVSPPGGGDKKLI